MMEKTRKGFTPGTEIQSGENTYKILDEFAYGGSAIIYRALKNGKENITLKEIYPSNENGFFKRNEKGQVMPFFSFPENQKEQELLERLYLQLEKEEEIGRRLRDDSFLVCNLKRLETPHLEESPIELKGFAEMMNMETSGKVLAKHLAELSVQYQKRIPLDISIHIIRQIAETMLKIHNSGYLYCDFSKGNIFLLNETMTAVFIDFGSTIEKTADDVETDQFIPSTWGYRAPEVALQNYAESKKRIISEASDVYALMTFFYELISGKPFAEETEFGKTKHPRDRMVDWKRMQEIGIKNPVAGLVLNHILIKGLEWSREDRIQNIRELLKMITQLELVQKKAEYLYETLALASNWNYEEKIKMLESFFRVARPEKKYLREALEQLGKELQSNFQLGTVTYVYKWLEIWIRNMEETEEKLTPRMKLLLEYSGLAICNHHGKYQEAIQHYEACESMRDQIELSQYLDARLRVAEGYANFFDYKKAHALVKENMELLQMRKDCYKEMAGKLGTNIDNITKTTEYGKNANALARYSSFLSGKEIKNADRFFQLAIDEFVFDEANRIRVYNSALQMAISAKDRQSFDKYYMLCIGKENVEKKILKILTDSSINSQEAYNLYVLLKSILVFGNMDEMSEDFWFELEQLAKGDIKKERKNHPWELIYRHTAILFSEHNKKVDKAAEELFKMSRNIMNPFQEFPNIEEIKTLSFDTLFVLHMMTWLQEYRLRLKFETNEEQKEIYQSELYENMEKMRAYLKKHKCKVASESKWKSADSIEDKYRLLEIYSTYEYA